MSGPAKRARGARATWVGGTLLCATGCFEAAVTDFYEEPSAIVVTSGGAGPTGAGSGGSGSAGGSQGASAGAGASGGTEGEGATGNSGAGASSGLSGGAGGDTSAGGLGGAAACERYAEDAAAFGGHCYLFVESRATFRAASEDCAERGGHLVTLSSDGRTLAEFLAENSFVWTLGGMTQLWIAATDGKQPAEPGDGTYYRWTTGEPMTFDNWSPSQPNNSAAGCQDDHPCSCDQRTCYEHCGFQWLNAGKDGAVPGWNDRLCEHSLAYVCEWDAP